MHDEQYYRNLIGSINATISSEQNRIAAAQTKIDRLNAVYNKISEEKQSVKALKKDCKKVADDLKWKGTAFDNFKDAKDTLVLSAEGYKGKVDTLMDEILSEISRLENSKYSSWNIIGRMNGPIASPNAMPIRAIIPAKAI